MRTSMQSYNPKITMDPSVKVTTQSAKYDQLLVAGPLTDARIAYYERQGYYGTQRQLRALEREKEREKRQKAKLTLDDILEGL